MDATFPNYDSLYTDLFLDSPQFRQKYLITCI